jgi:small subunit ribosomal protein S21
MTKKPHKKGLVVEVHDGNISSALKKFKRKVDDSNKLIDIVKRSFYEKPTTERKRKKGAAKARWKKKMADQQLPKKQY